MDRPDNENRRVQYYSDGRFSDDKYFDNSGGAYGKRRMPTWVKALIIILGVIVGMVVLGAACDSFVSGITGGDVTNEVTTDFGHDYVGVLYVQDAIDEYGTGIYNHQYALNAVDAMMADTDNKGMILYVDTPGGSVFASDELYLKIKEYQQATGRPVYSSMQSQATSGGYYISASCDKIIANRNCWTGSIGVTMGSFIDISELLDNLGIKTETITSGPNKAMGSTVEPMTAEQKAIWQALIDESYEQFVAIVAEGRKMPIEKVKALADGRIYSALQAAENGLIDQVGTFEDAVSDMAATYKLGDIAIEHFQPELSTDLSDLLGVISEQKNLGAVTDAEAIEALLELNGTFRVSYISKFTK